MKNTIKTTAQDIAEPHNDPRILAADSIFNLLRHPRVIDELRLHGYSIHEDLTVLSEIVA